MKRFKLYINTFYRPAFIALCIGLAIFSLSLCIFATNLRADIIAGESDFIYKYPVILEKILFPIYILIPVTLIVDLNERKKRSR